MRINWNEPRFDESELKEIESVIKDNYVNEGPKTKELEEKVKNYLNVKNTIITTNATAALFLAVKSEAIIRGVTDFEVIVPDMTMIATATAVGWAGGKAVLVDIERDRATIDLSKIEEKISEKTIAIIPVHILGRSAEMTKLKEMADKHNLLIIEDAAGALGSKYDGQFLGTIGDIGCYSLQSNKLITSGQGGIIVTNSDKHYEVMRRLRDFGRLSNKEFMHEAEGYNLKFNDLSAALAIAQFKKIDERISLLKKQLFLYKKLLDEVEQVSFFPIKDEEVPLWVDVLVEDRADLVSFLKENEIFTRECWPAIHRNPPYRSQGTDSDFPNSSFISDNTLWLPNGPAITDEQINLITSKIKEFYGS